MRTIIAGTRTAKFKHTIDAILSCPWVNATTMVLSGMAEGADTHGGEWARMRAIQVVEYKAAWNHIGTLGAVIRYRRDGKPYNARAGLDRNQRMVDNADALIVAWDGKSRGTADIVRRAKAKGLRVHVYDYTKDAVIP